MLKRSLIKVVLLLAVLMSVVSCDEIKDIINPEDEDVDVEIEGRVSTIVGRGYDVTGEYAVSEGVKQPILNIQSLANDKQLLEDMGVASADATTISGTSISEYQESLTASAGISGGYRGFSGEVGASFSSSEISNTERSYATILKTIKKTAWFIDNRHNTDYLKTYLDTTFQTDLNDLNYSIDDLFKNYGTHCILGAVYGARLNYNLSAERSSVVATTSLDTYINVKYKGLFASGGVSASAATAATTGLSSSSIEEHTKVVGGNAEYGIDDKANYDKWIASIDGKGIFIDYYKDGLCPIWDFCDDEGRKSAIIKAFSAYVISKQVAYLAFSKVRITVKTMTISDADDGGETSADILYAFLVQDLFGLSSWNKLNPKEDSNSGLIDDEGAWGEIAMVNDYAKAWSVSKEGAKSFCTYSKYLHTKKTVYLESRYDVGALVDEGIYFKLKTYVEETDAKGSLRGEDNEVSINGDIIEITGLQLKEMIDFTVEVEGEDRYGHNKAVVTYEVTF